MNDGSMEVQNMGSVTMEMFELGIFDKSVVLRQILNIEQLF